MDSDKKRAWPKVIGAILILLVAYAAYSSVGSKEEPIEYETVKLELKTVKAYVAAIGKIESTTTVTVGSQVSGPVSEVLVDFNSPVERGQVLAKIDPSEFLARQAAQLANLQAAEAGLASAQANLIGQGASVRQAEVDVMASKLSLEQAVRQVDVTRAGVRTAKSNYESSKAERENSLLAYQRAEDLVKRELVALSERDQARTNYLVASASVETALASIQQSEAQLAQIKSQRDSAQNDIEAAQSRLSLARANRDAAAAQVSSATATVAQAQAALAQSAVDLQRTTITSPISGVVIDRKVDEGQTVAAQFQAPELFTIARDLDKMQVKAEVSEADIGRVTEGSPVKFSVDAYPGREFSGAVTQVRSAPDQGEDGTAASNVVVYGVLVNASNPEQLLKPGMTATVEILAEKLEDALVVPGQALRYVPAVEDEKEKEKDGSKGKRKPSKSPSPSPTPGQKKEEKLKPGTRKGTVWVLEGEEPKRRDIVTGISVEDDVVVISGDLKAGEEVIIDESGGKKKRSRFRLSF
jgi:HlyD family secretion protein